MIIYGKNPVSLALKKGKDIEKLYIVSEKNKKGKPKLGEKSAKETSKKENLEKFIEEANSKGISIERLDKKSMDILCDNGNHQNVALALKEYEYIDFEKLLIKIHEKREKNENALVLILDGIQDPQNLGAIARSALGFKADAIIIGKNRSVQVTASSVKASAGAILDADICQVTNLVRTIESLKKEGMWIYAMDFDGDEISKTDLKGNVCLVIGSEGKGVSRLVKEKSDFTISIPTCEKLESLNASVAAAIALYEAARQREN